MWIAFAYDSNTISYDGMTAKVDVETGAVLEEAVNKAGELFALIYKLLVQTWYSFGVLTTTGFALAFKILSSLKEDSELTYLPLVPAFSLGALYFLFF